MPVRGSLGHRGARYNRNHGATFSRRMWHLDGVVVLREKWKATWEKVSTEMPIDEGHSMGTTISNSVSKVDILIFFLEFTEMPQPQKKHRKNVKKSFRLKKEETRLWNWSLLALIEPV